MSRDALLACCSLCKFRTTTTVSAVLLVFEAVLCVCVRRGADTYNTSNIRYQYSFFAVRDTEYKLEEVAVVAQVHQCNVMIVGRCVRACV